MTVRLLTIGTEKMGVTISQTVRNLTVQNAGSNHVAIC